MPKRKNQDAGKVRALCSVMERIAPSWAAADWDNVGLLVGDRAWPARRVLLAIDLTPVVLDEAIRQKCDVIVSYHPVIFRASKRMLLDRTAQEGLAAEALSRRIAVYSPHTSLDSACGGANDTLAGLAGLVDAVPFETASGAGAQCKLVVFVPEGDLDCVAEAVFAAGAGRIGEYEKCSYRLHGRGTFFGTDGTDPVIGKKGRLETVEEVRLEVILPMRRLADVTAAVRRSHSYEEPAFDVYPLTPIPDARIGQGRLGSFERPVTLRELALRLEKATGAKNVVTIGKMNAKLNRGLVYVGAAGTNPFESPDRFGGAGDVVITGEISHHNALRYARCGTSAVALGHWASERPMLKPLMKMLKNEMKSVSFFVSRADCDPFGSV